MGFNIFMKALRLIVFAKNLTPNGPSSRTRLEYFHSNLTYKRSMFGNPPLFQTQLEMSSTDLVAELRAEVTHWWEQLQKQQILANQQREASGIGMEHCSFFKFNLGAVFPCFKSKLVSSIIPFLNFY
ncbi:hypothetical protein DPMN_086995 [Dreissena polymorpha]|uniref:Uncharacterized protein n=1 Tax=Dreissena polymorpha TaxID=45954 RepID=A0A9D4KRF1_DREPO|nr:hypothetical protein DPMN_086995 [Dreissena polymorpha]